MSLFSDFSKKLAMSVLSFLGIADVVNDWDEVIVQRFNNAVIGENGHTARYTIVSDTAQRITVHCPDENWFTGFGRLDSSVPEIMTPLDFSPFLLSSGFS